MISTEVGMGTVPQVTQAFNQIRAPHKNASKKCEPLMVAYNLYDTKSHKVEDFVSHTLNKITRFTLTNSERIIYLIGSILNGRIDENVQARCY